MKLLVSACLSGENCKYNGGNNKDERLLKLLEGHEVTYVCPEVSGGLPTPRVPSEICGTKVINREGKDVTKEFLQGAANALAIAQEIQPDLVILKSRSPSCGLREHYDGTFTKTLVKGPGITAALLKEYGFRMLEAEDLTEKLPDLNSGNPGNGPEMFHTSETTKKQE